MKKIVCMLMVALVLFGVASAEMYPATARVVSVDYESDTVTVETFTGFLFTFEGCEDWMVNDCCSLIMDDNGTEKIYDDVILMAYYGGWLLGRWTEQ